MKVNAIVYTSATGFTRRYAQMLGERTGLPVHDLRGGIPPVRGTRVLYLGWLFAGGVKDLARARRKWNVRASAVRCCCPPDSWSGRRRSRPSSRKRRIYSATCPRSFLERLAAMFCSTVIVGNSA